jgi:hypothetical protein
VGPCRDSADLAELRGRIIQVFFKHLTSSNEVAVAMSQDGLVAVIAHQKMPKTLLQVPIYPKTLVLRCQHACLCRYLLKMPAAAALWLFSGAQDAAAGALWLVFLC